MIIERMIAIDSPQAKTFGFTSDKFDGYLWQKDRTIIISLVNSKNPGKGDFKKLCHTIKEAGFKIQVPTPLAQMESILKKWGWKFKIENDEKFGPVEIYESDVN